MNILVTGATGFIGKRVVSLSEKTGHVTRVLTRRPFPGKDTVICDLLHEEIPPEALSGIETVIHLAGYAHNPPSDKRIHIEKYRALNVNAALRLAQLASENGVKRFVFVSSVKAGGKPLPGECMDEKDQTKPEGIYALTKREAEKGLLNFGRDSGLEIVIVRPSLVYGPTMKGYLQQMLRGIAQGWFPPLPETGNRRSLIHVDDLSRALLFLSEKPSIAGEIFIATDGQYYSSRQIYEALRSATGRKSKPRWYVPSPVFRTAARFNTRWRNMVEKIFEDECYNPKKLLALGFAPRLSLKDVMKSTF